MVTNSLHGDPIDDEVDRVLADPAIRARLEDFEARFRRGEVSPVAHAEVRRRLGLDLPEEKLNPPTG